MKCILKILFLMTLAVFLQNSAKANLLGDLQSASIYQRKIADDLYFIMERVDEGRAEPWTCFAATTFDATMSADEQQRFSVQASTREASSYFSSGLRKGPWEKWVLFASDIPYSEMQPWDQFTPHIEMCCVVSTDGGVPFTQHMGIFRPYTYKGIRHPHISLELHMYGAQVMLDLYPSKIYLISMPSHKMYDMFKGHFGNGYANKVEQAAGADGSTMVTVYSPDSEEMLIRFSRPQWMESPHFIVPLQVATNRPN